jgi:hypothetical protein
VPREVRNLIRTMSEANPLWGAPRIHGELVVCENLADGLCGRAVVELKHAAEALPAVDGASSRLTWSWALEIRLRELTGIKGVVENAVRIKQLCHPLGELRHGIALLARKGQRVVRRHM